MICATIRRFVREEIIPLEETELDADAYELPEEHEERLRPITESTGIPSATTPASSPRSRSCRGRPIARQSRLLSRAIRHHRGSSRRYGARYSGGGLVTVLLSHGVRVPQQVKEGDSGVRILDLTIVVAGPVGTSILGPGPEYSEHTEQMLRELLSLTDDEITALAEAGAIALPERAEERV